MEINYKSPQKILTKTSGFLSAYSHSLNPYMGCSFGCSYCYVRQSPVGLFRKQEWGTWVDVKQVMKEKIKKEIRTAKKRGKVTIFMSSSTDPYQSLEYRQRVTRSLLEIMTEVQPDFLFVQTRGPLVVRDIDLLAKLKTKVKVSMTVETDLDTVRKRFAPYSSPIQSRLKAVRSIRESGIPVQIAVAPVLPFSEEFPHKLAQLVDRVCIDDYFTGDGSQGKRTERLPVKELYHEDELDKWYSKKTHLYALEKLNKVFSPEQILISQDGFMPC